MIRPAKESDIPAMLAIYGPYVEATAYSFEYTVPTAEEFTARFRAYTAQFPWLVWEEDGEVLGYAYGSAPFTRAAYGWCAELSVYIAPKAHRRGIGKALYQVAEEILFRQGYQVIYCLITSANTASVAFHGSMGYKTVAELPDCGVKFGQRYGIIYMEKRSNSVEIPTSFPAPANLLVQDARFLRDILFKFSLS